MPIQTAAIVIMPIALGSCSLHSIVLKSWTGAKQRGSLGCQGIGKPGKGRGVCGISLLFRDSIAEPEGIKRECGEWDRG